jgi:small GTP-binding protein
VDDSSSINSVAQIAKLKSELVNGPGGKTAGTKNAERGFDVTKSGDTRIGLVGFPSVGKSTLLTSLTGTRSEAAAYEFTTLTCIPGTMNYKGARIQVLDLPGIIEGAADGKGRGRQVISTARTCNLILVVLDAGKPVTHKKIIEQELFSFGIRINQSPPDVKVVKKEQGGIGYQETVVQTKGMNKEVCRVVCKEYKITCAEIILREDVTVDQFIDVLEGNRAYMPVLYVFNKIDSITIEELDILDQMPVRIGSAGWNRPLLRLLRFCLVSHCFVLFRITFLFHHSTCGTWKALWKKYGIDATCSGSTPSLRAKSPITMDQSFCTRKEILLWRSFVIDCTRASWQILPMRGYGVDQQSINLNDAERTTNCATKISYKLSRRWRRSGRSRYIYSVVFQFHIAIY